MSVGLRRRFASTRVRLTLWYAALLVIVLVALGVSVEALAHNRLQADVDRRLVSTAEDIGTVIQQRLATWSFSSEPVRFEDIVPNLGSFASRGLIVQITDPTGRVVRGSEYAPETPLVPEDAAPSGDTRVVTTTWNGDQMRAVHYPVTVTDRSGTRWYIGAVIVGERLNTMQETLGSLRQVLMVASGLGILLAMAGGADPVVREPRKISAFIPDPSPNRRALGKGTSIRRGRYFYERPGELRMAEAGQASVVHRPLPPSPAVRRPPSTSREALKMPH